MTMVVDAHVHFWDPEALPYPWLDGIPSLQRAFLPRDYAGDVAQMVFVEANCAPELSADEADFVDRLAMDDPRIAATVAFVDVRDDRQRAERLDRLSRNPRVAGIRHNIQGMPRGFCLDPRFVGGVRDVGARGFSFDLCVTADQLVETTALVERCPGMQFVLDHCGKPAVRDDAFDAWARDLEAIARFPNVACKLSGLLTEARADQRDAASLRPYVEHVRASFGATRLLYGSDWPVVTLAGGLELWMSLVEQLTTHWTEEERRRLFAENAVRLYRLGQHAHS